MKVVFSPWTEQGLSYLAKSLLKDEDIITFHLVRKCTWNNNYKELNSVIQEYQNANIPIIYLEVPLLIKNWTGQIYFVPMLEYLDINIHHYLSRDVIYIAVSTDVQDILINKYKISKDKVLFTEWDSPFRRFNDYHNRDYIQICHVSSGNSWQDRSNVKLIDNIIPHLPQNIKLRIHLKNVDNLKNINSNNVVFSTGTKSREYIEDIYRNSDISLYPSKFEGFNVAALESISYGVPVISSNIQPVTHYIKNDENGYIIDGVYFKCALANGCKLTETSVINVINSLNIDNINTMKQNIEKNLYYTGNSNFNDLVNL